MSALLQFREKDQLPSARDPLYREIGQQRERIEELECELEQLKSLWKSPPYVPRSLGLRPAAVLVLGVLMKLAGKVVTREALFQALVESPRSRLERDRSDFSQKNVDVQICHLRAVLRPHGIDIQPVWGEGFRLLKAGAERMAEIIDEAVEAEDAAAAIAADTRRPPAKRKRLPDLVGCAIVAAARAFGENPLDISVRQRMKCRRYAARLILKLDPRRGQNPDLVKQLGYSEGAAPSTLSAGIVQADLYQAIEADFLKLAAEWVPDWQPRISSAGRAQSPLGPA